MAAAVEKNPPAIVALFRQLDGRRCALEVATRFLALGAGLALAIIAPWYIAPVAILVIGVAQYHILVLSHEAQHVLIAQDRMWNDRIGAWLLAYPFGQPFHSERARHLAHHRLVGTPADPDYRRYVLDDKHPWRQMIGYYVRLATWGKPWEYLASVLRRSAPTPSTARDTRSGSELLTVATMQCGVLGCFWVLASPWHYVGFWLVPLLTVTTTLSEVRELCEHVTTARLQQTLKTFRVPRWQRVLLGPVGFAYHAEHHLWPSIPHYHLASVAAHFPDSTDEFDVHHSYFDVLRRCATP